MAPTSKPSLEKDFSSCEALAKFACKVVTDVFTGWGSGIVPNFRPLAYGANARGRGRGDQGFYTVAFAVVQHTAMQ